MNSRYLLLLTALTASPALAFTNGSLVPAYLCNAVADGLPKTFGQVLALTREQTPTVAFSQNAGQNVVAPPLQQQNASSVGNSAYILASLHDSPNSIQTQQGSLVIKLAKGNNIIAGQSNAITVSTKDNSQLKGAVLVAQDSTGQRQGKFTDGPGGPFIPFPGCGPNAQGDISGVIQQTGITAKSSYSKLVFNAPACIPGGNITMAGLSVTGSGFGQWSQTFQVTGSNCGGAAPAGGAGSAAGGKPATGGKSSIAVNQTTQAPAAASQQSTAASSLSKSAAAPAVKPSSASSRVAVPQPPAKAVASGCSGKPASRGTTARANVQGAITTTMVKVFRTSTTSYVNQ